jgi:predicted ATPase
MPPQLSKEMRRLAARWDTKTGWPKRMDYLEIEGIRGWTGQRFEFAFPIMAVVGENGAGKSTVLQAAASGYASTPARTKFRFASDFFPDTPWDKVRGAELRYAVREGGAQHLLSVRKPTDRWRGNPDRRERNVEYIDLSRVQPVPARVGYTRLANPALQEAGSRLFADDRLDRLNSILGRQYDLARMATTIGDQTREVPVVSQQGQPYSGFHQGAGETTIMEFLQRDMPKYSLVVIDEIESSLHPRAQRRLMRDLADKCRENELQVILSTHSPYVLEELPLAARAYILVDASGGREIVYGVSPEFAMTKMDEMPHYEIDLYVEDDRAGRMLMEILAAYDPDLALACQAVPYGAASVGQALGVMVDEQRFPRKTCVFLDGDRGPSRGCLVLPGEDAPERVVFDALSGRGWVGVGARVGREYPALVDACERAMTGSEHHAWVHEAASRLVLGADTLWQAMCAVWAIECLPPAQAQRIAGSIREMADVPAAGTITSRPEFGVARVGRPGVSPIAHEPQPALWPDDAQD